METIDKLVDLLILLVQENPWLAGLMITFAFIYLMVREYSEYQQTVGAIERFKESTETSFNSLRSVLGPLVARINRLADSFDALDTLLRRYL